MLKQQFRSLKKNAIGELCQSSTLTQAIIVQVYNITIGKNDKVSCFLSDGNYCIKAFLKEKNALSPETHQNSLIRIIQHVMADSGKKLGIIDFEMLCEYNKPIGFPKPFDPETMNNPQEIHPYPIELKSVKKDYINMVFQPIKIEPIGYNNQNTKPIKQQQPKRQQKKQMRFPVAQPLKGNVKDYETIKGLFIGLKGWHLLCRITKLDYQEFNKKNTNTLVKILNIELMDRSQVKISGAFFYEAAEKFRNQIKLNSVYKISEGQITNENYNNSKNEKISPFRLVFNVNSHFEEVSDVQIIANSQDSAIALNHLLLNPVYDQEFDIIGILAQIEQPKEITKENRSLMKWQWVIVDPIRQKKIYAILWNDKIKPDQSLIGRTIILSRFILKNYNGSLTLNSKARSGIEPVVQHFYQSMEEKVMIQYKNYDNLSDRRIKQEDPNNKGIIYDNLKSLTEAISNMGTGDSLKSDLNVWVNRFNTKKWFYEGCPQCNKSAEKGTSCNCGKYVEEIVPHFIMSTELSDAYGSIWTTSYDEQSKKIFWEQEGVIHKLIKLDQNQLKDVVEDYLFQEFKVRLYTKKDQEGRIKHTMGRLQLKVPEKAAQENVEKIRAMMSEMMM